MSNVLLLTTESDPVADAVGSALDGVVEFIRLDPGEIGQRDLELGSEDVLLVADSALEEVSFEYGQPGLVQFLGCRQSPELIGRLSSTDSVIAGISPAIAPRVSNRVIGFAGSLLAHAGERDAEWGVIGLGSTGTELAWKLAETGTSVTVADIRTPRVGILDELGARRKTLDLLVSGADVISLHVGAGPTASPLISERELGLMKPEAILINTSASGIVDEQAVLAAVSGGMLGGYATDCPGDVVRGADDSLVSSGELIVTTNPLTNQIGAAQQLAKYVAMNVHAFRNGEDVEGRIEMIDFPKIGDPSFWSSKMSNLRP